jgi:hypothetical protein
VEVSPGPLVATATPLLRLLSQERSLAAGFQSRGKPFVVFQPRRRRRSLHEGAIEVSCLPHPSLLLDSRVKTPGSCRAAATLQRRSPPWRRCLGKLGAWVGFAVSVTLALLQQRSSACSRCLLGGSASWVLRLFAVKAPVHRAGCAV